MRLVFSRPCALCQKYTLFHTSCVPEASRQGRQLLCEECVEFELWYACLKNSLFDETNFMGCTADAEAKHEKTHKHARR